MKKKRAVVLIFFLLGLAPKIAFVAAAEPAVELAPEKPQVVGQELTRVSQGIEASQTLVHPKEIILPYHFTTVIHTEQIQRYLTTTPEILRVTQIAPDSLSVTAQEYGSGVIHLWDREGRSSYRIQVIQPPIPKEAARPALLVPEEEKVSPFKLTYQGSRFSFHQGPETQGMSRTSLFWNHTIGMRREADWGNLAAWWNYRRLNEQGEVGGYSASLTNVNLGPMEKMELYLFDYDLRLDQLTSGFAQLRGFQWGAQIPKLSTPRIGPLRPSLFWGRQRVSPLGALLPGTSGEPQDFITGLSLDSPYTSSIGDGSLRGSYLHGYGKDRLRSIPPDFWATTLSHTWDLFHFRQDLGYDGRHWAELSNLSMDLADLTASVGLRNASEEFFTMTGRSGLQGETGGIFNLYYHPRQIPISLHGSYELDKDRLLLNPKEPDALNTRETLSFSWNPTPWRITLDQEISNQTGTNSPSELEAYGVSLGRTFKLGKRSLDVGTFYHYTLSESRINPNSNFITNRVAVQGRLGLLKDLYLSLGEELTVLNETGLGTGSRPRAFTASLDYDFQLPAQFKIPLRGRSSVRHRNEEQSGSARSFLIGEDFWEWNLDLRHRMGPNLETFFTGRLKKIKRELDESHRSEADLTFGTDGQFDFVPDWKPTSSISGVVFLDENGNGIQDPAEAGIADQLILINNQSRQLTDSKGRYLFKEVTSKKADVQLDLSQLPVGSSLTTPERQLLRLKEKEHFFVNFGITQISEVHGLIFNDLNGNKLFDPKDRPLGNISIILDKKRVVQSDERGAFRFHNVSIGSHELTLDIKTLAYTYIPEVPILHSFSLEKGTRYSYEFPVRAQRSAEGRVYVDVNENRQWDPDQDQPINEVNILVDDRLSAVTDREGQFTLSDLPVGLLEIKLDPTSLPGGYQPLEPTRHYPILPAEGGELSGYDFRLKHQD